MVRSNDRLEDLEEALGYRFRDRKHLLAALNHSTAVNEKLASADNTRMAFVGDAVIELAVRMHAPSEQAAKVGELSLKADDAVRNSNLASVAQRRGLADFLEMGKGGSKDARHSETTLAEAFEAVACAIVDDAGLDHGLKVVRRLLELEG